MSSPAPPPRAWRAACLQCGAPVEFASAASPLAVCGYCRSTLVREGEALRRIGQSAELFDDHSPLQLGSAGRWQALPFRLVGRLQMGDRNARWNAWHALFDNGRSGWLSEDNGRYVMVFDAVATSPLPDVATLRPGAQVTLGGRVWSVASVVSARVLAAEGELPRVPNLQGEHRVADLRNADGEVATLDDTESAAGLWSAGRRVELADLALTGLREGSEATLGARSVECPSCGAGLSIRLGSTKSIACGQCKAVVDVSQGVGADLAFYAQGNPTTEAAGPTLPLGSTGRLALGGPLLPWQVVGYAERCEIPSDADDERVFWREYLLYSREAGFSFLVDAEDGWSWATPLTGAPQVQGDTAAWQGTRYRQRWIYAAQTTYVLGEFYWRLQRGERSHHIDYAAGAQRLNREQTGDEITWSAGEALDAAHVASAFRLSPAAAAVAARATDTTPMGDTATLSQSTQVVIIVAALLVTSLLMQRCSREDCDEVRDTFGAESSAYQQCLRDGGSHRTGGGSYGGWGSGGGGHK